MHRLAHHPLTRIGDARVGQTMDGAIGGMIVFFVLLVAASIALVYAFPSLNIGAF